MPLTRDSLRAMAGQATSARDTARPAAPAVNPSARRGMLYDMTRCIGCQACTVACKQWNSLPVTMNDGRIDGPSIQSLPDTGPNDWTLMRFSEVEWPSAPGGMLFRMRKDACHHCDTMPCATVCSSNAIFKTEDGAVVIDQEKCIGCGYCTGGCPFGVPKVDASRSKATKCTMCYDRTQHGLEPACATACPTDAIIYGDLTELHAEAERRVKNYNARRPEGTPAAYVYDAPELGGLGVFYILNAPVENYSFQASLPKNPTMPATMWAWDRLLKPAGWMAILGAAVAAGTHLKVIGAKRFSDPETLPTPSEFQDGTITTDTDQEATHG